MTIAWLERLNGFVALQYRLQRRHLIHETAIYCLKPTINCSAQRV